MKKHAKTVKRLVAMALSVIMVISLFPNSALRAFAEELADATNSNGVKITESASDETVDLTGYGESNITTPDVTTAYFEDDSVLLYEEYREESHTATVNGAAGTKIYLYDKIAFYCWNYTAGKIDEEQDDK